MEQQNSENSLEAVPIHGENEQNVPKISISTTTSESKSKSGKQKLIEFVDKYWFLVGVVIVIILARIAPNIGKKGGLIHSEYTIKYVATSMIFFLSGLSLKTRELKNAILHWKLHATVQTYNLFFIPLFVFALVKLLEVIFLSRSVGEGLIIMGALPTSISSCVVLVKSVGGNEAAALFNASFGNVLGLFATPLWLLLFLGNSASTPVGSILLNIGITVIMPIIIGQIVQFSFPTPVDKLKSKINFAKVNNFILLLIIWSTFCETFSQKQNVGISNVLIVATIAVSLHVLFLIIAFFGSGISYIDRFLHFTRKDRMVIVFCGAQKTIALGIPLISIMYENDANLALKSLPILIYHPAQLLIDATLVTRFKKWVSEEQTQVPEEDQEAQSSLLKSTDHDDQNIENSNEQHR